MDLNITQDGGKGERVYGGLTLQDVIFDSNTTDGSGNKYIGNANDESLNVNVTSLTPLGNISFDDYTGTIGGTIAPSNLGDAVSIPLVIHLRNGTFMEELVNITIVQSAFTTVHQPNVPLLTDNLFLYDMYPLLSNVSGPATQIIMTTVPKAGESWLKLGGTFPNLFLFGNPPANMAYHLVRIGLHALDSEVRSLSHSYFNAHLPSILPTASSNTNNPTTSYFRRTGLLPPEIDYSRRSLFSKISRFSWNGRWCLR